jgi:hypothetical protein
MSYNPELLEQFRAKFKEQQTKVEPTEIGRGYRCRYNRFNPSYRITELQGIAELDNFKGASASTQTGQERLPCVRRKPLNLLGQRQVTGITWKEFSEITGLHHGTASGVLSVLHKAGRIARLKELVTVVKSMLM